MMSSDYFKVNSNDIAKKKLFLFDMDGTIYNEDEIFDGTLKLLSLIKSKGASYKFITNNSSKSSKDYVNKLKKMNICVDEDDIFSSIDASIVLLKEKYPNALVYVQGTKSFIEELKEEGIRVTEVISDDISLVLTGFDTELTFEKLNRTCEILSTREVPYYATNPDLVCPCKYGYVPDNGSVAQMIENATKKKPIFIGKPEPLIIDLACKKYGIDKKDTIIIGDRLYTDIAVGINAKVDTICVLTGEANLEDIKNSIYKPNYVFESVKEIASAISSCKLSY